MTGIIVGVDGSPEAAAALRWAHNEAAARRTSLTAVFAWDWANEGHAIVGPDFDPASGEAFALAAVEAAVSAALEPARAAAVARTVVRGLPVPALLDVSADADLLVLGARGLGGFKSLLLGSVSQECTHHAVCPVAVVRGDIDRPPRAINRIVVGIDGSKSAHRALTWSLNAARVHHASVEVVHAWTFPYVGGDAVPAMAYDPGSLARAARQVVDQAVESADTSDLITPVERTVTSERATRGLLKAAEHADLVVVGSRGRGGFVELLLGSVSQQVVHHAKCTVVVIPPTARSVP